MRSISLSSFCGRPYADRRIFGVFLSFFQTCKDTIVFARASFWAEGIASHVRLPGLPVQTWTTAQINAIELSGFTLSPLCHDPR